MLKYAYFLFISSTSLSLPLVLPLAPFLFPLPLWIAFLQFLLVFLLSRECTHVGVWQAFINYHLNAILKCMDEKTRRQAFVRTCMGFAIVAVAQLSNHSWGKKLNFIKLCKHILWSKIEITLKEYVQCHALLRSWAMKENGKEKTPERCTDYLF